MDSGIGGGIAEIVGRQLRELGNVSQALCVTHLAQVAAQAHSQFRVIKQTDGKATRTAVKVLSPADRIDEIARMLGGIDISEQARAHAREMLGSVVGKEASRGTAAKAALAPAAAPKTTETVAQGRNAASAPKDAPPRPRRNKPRVTE